MASATAPELRDFADRVLRAAGLAPGHAASAAAGLVAANLRGVDSHGVLRLTQYVASIAGGEIETDPDVRVVFRRGSTALVDAGGGYGFAPAQLAMDTAIELAREHAIGFVGVRASHHFGMGASYVLRAAEAGFIGWLTTTSQPVVVPTGSAVPVVGNNPLAYAIPRRAPQPPIVLDMALSEVAFGKIRLAAAEGRPIPLGWGFDAQGRPTTDAAAALAAEALAPTGGHKGSGLAIVGEVLAGVLTGSPFGLASHAHAHREGGVGHLLTAIDPAVFVFQDEYEDGVEELVTQLKSATRAEGVSELLLPGEIERRTEETRRVEGIPVSDELTAKLAALAARLGVEPPAWG